MASSFRPRSNFSRFAAHALPILVLLPGAGAAMVSGQTKQLVPTSSGTLPKPENDTSSASPFVQLDTEPLTPDELMEYGVVSTESRNQEQFPPDQSGPYMGGETRRYEAMRVQSDGSANQFYYIRQDHYMRLFPELFEPARFEAYRAFGPHPIDAQVRVLKGVNYYFLPLCRDGVTVLHLVSKQASARAKAKISCQK